MLLITLLLALLIIGVLVPFVVRQEKRRKAKFKERKQRLMAIGSEYDDGDRGLPKIQAQRTTPKAPSTPPTASRRDTNPYRPPADGS